MILLAKNVEGGEPCFGTLDMTVKRNTYGRQLGSFVCKEQFSGQEITLCFIRAPYAESVGNGAEILAAHDGKTVAVRQGRQLATAFHPELTADTAVYDLFFKRLAKS